MFSNHSYKVIIPRCDGIKRLIHVVSYDQDDKVINRAIIVRDVIENVWHAGLATFDTYPEALESTLYSLLVEFDEESKQNNRFYPN